MRLVAAFLAFSTLVVVGCGSSRAEDQREPEIDSFPPLTRVDQIKAPIATYQPTGTELATIHNAVEVLSVPCAERFGVAHAPIVYLNQAVAVELSSRYGPLDKEWVAVNGYQPQEPRLPEGPEWDPSPREYEVLTGFDEAGALSSLVDDHGEPLHEGGCLGEASSELFGAQPFDAALMRLVDEGLSYSRERMVGDSRVVAAFEDWARCMTGRGYPISTVQDRNELLASYASKRDEVAIALVDVECSQETNFPGIQQAVDQAYQERWLREHAADIQALRDGYIAGLERAVDVLSGR